MARPVNADPSETRRRILDAATTLFAERGLEGTSVRDVARDAGVSVGIVHHYFGSKEALHQRCVQVLYGQLNEGLRPLADMFGQTVTDLSNAEDADEDLARVVTEVLRTAFRFARDRQDVVRMVMRTVVETGEMEPTWRAQTHLPFLQRTAAALAPLTGMPEEELRLIVQSMTALIMRYALATPAELARMAGRPAEAGETAPAWGDEVHARIEAHLVRTGLALVGSGAWADSAG